ncbi:MAG TPA: efflux RND transporter periplasmic adaptor subunit [Gemmatimonadaceae bacterium]|nr:efflux RND transporter periplasmic adaptor subunit [Gemmatimonadaceae bacterium]
MNVRAQSTTRGVITRSLRTLTRRGTARATARAFALGATAMAVAACGDTHTPPPQVVPVTVASVERSSVPWEISATGTVEPLQTVSVASQVSGILTEVGFNEGDEVRRGQVLFRIDPRPFQAALAQAQAVHAKDQAQLVAAEQDVKRYESLVEKDYVTPQQFEQMKANAASLRATVKADEAAVENAQLNLQYATIRAPIDGRAGALLLKKGNLVRAAGQTLVVVNQLRPILVRFSVPASNLPDIRKYKSDSLVIHAQPASGVGETARGTLSFLDNAVDTTTGTIMLKGLFPNKDGELWPGEFVNVALELFVEKNAVVAPAPAIVQSQNGTYVFVVKNDTAQTRDVTVARTVGDIAVIAKGLSPGEMVVTDGQLRLTSGAKVQIKGAPNADQPRAE